MKDFERARNNTEYVGNLDLIDYALGDDVVYLASKVPAYRVKQALFMEMFGRNPERDVKVIYKYKDFYMSQLLVKNHKDEWEVVYTRYSYDFDKVKISYERLSNLLPKKTDALTIRYEVWLDITKGMFQYKLSMSTLYKRWDGMVPKYNITKGLVKEAIELSKKNDVKPEVRKNMNILFDYIYSIAK